MIRILSCISNSRASERMCEITLKFASTATDVPASRESHSKEIFPVPAHKSNKSKSYKSNRFSNILNKPSLAKSVVGREGKFLGTVTFLVFNKPLIIRTTVGIYPINNCQFLYESLTERLFPINFLILLNQLN